MSRAVLLLVIGLASACHGAGLDEHRPRSVELRGYVCQGERLVFVSENEREKLPTCHVPVPGGVVTLASADGTELTVEADDTGYFEIGPIRLAGRDGDLFAVSWPGRVGGFSLAKFGGRSTRKIFVGDTWLYLEIPPAPRSLPPKDGGFEPL